jgi:multicomponent K+:H+ antiporter subunit E
MTKLLPSPLTSAALFAMWLVLARSTSVGQLLLAFGFALVVPLLTSRLRPKSNIRRPFVVVRYILTVGFDVIRSNLAVAWSLISWRKPTSKFVVVPLDLRDPLALSALAIVTTIVPGTVWSEIALDRSALLLHVWDVGDDRAFVEHFKARYEKPLMEIFE